MQDRLEPNAQRAADLLGGAVAATAPAWMPLVDHANHLVVLLTSLGGCILVWARVADLLRHRRRRES